jgi:hypothetical protein
MENNPHRPDRQTAETFRDGVADAVDKWREERAPRRKRYTLTLDLEAQTPANPQPNAPRAILDI